jgi:hypothetical protein
MRSYAVAIMVLWASAGWCQTTQEQSRGIRVTVRLEGTQTPLSGVKVSVSQRIGVDCIACTLPVDETDLIAYLQGLASGRPQEKPTAITDSNGNASFPDLKAGYYTVVAERPGLLGPALDSMFVDPLSAGAQTVVDLTKENRNKAVALTLGPYVPIAAGTIRGHVFDPEGRPIAGASVVPGMLVQSDGQRHAVFIDNGVRTNERGEFLLGVVTPFEYIVRVRVAFDPTSVSFYPSAATFEDAHVVNLRDSKMVEGIDITVGKRF